MSPDFAISSPAAPVISASGSPRSIVDEVPAASSESFILITLKYYCPICHTISSNQKPQALAGRLFQAHSLEFNALKSPRSTHERKSVWSKPQEGFDGRIPHNRTQLFVTSRFCRWPSHRTSRWQPVPQR